MNRSHSKYKKEYEPGVLSWLFIHFLLLARRNRRRGFRTLLKHIVLILTIFFNFALIIIGGRAQGHGGVTPPLRFHRRRHPPPKRPNRTHLHPSSKSSGWLEWACTRWINSYSTAAGSGLDLLFSGFSIRIWQHFVWIHLFIYMNPLWIYLFREVIGRRKWRRLLHREVSRLYRWPFRRNILTNLLLHRHALSTHHPVRWHASTALSK